MVITEVMFKAFTEVNKGTKCNIHRVYIYDTNGSLLVCICTDYVIINECNIEMYQGNNYIGLITDKFSKVEME